MGDPGGMVAGVGGGAPLGAGVVGGTVTGMLRQLQVRDIGKGVRCSWRYTSLCPLATGSWPGCPIVARHAHSLSSIV